MTIPSINEKLPAIVTDIRSNAEMASYAIAHPLGYAVGMRQFWRCQPFAVFRQDPATGTRVFVVADGKDRSLDALIKAFLGCPAGRGRNGMFRLYYGKVLPSAPVMAALERAGFTLVQAQGGFALAEISAQKKPAEKAKANGWAKTQVRKAVKKTPTAPVVTDMPTLPNGNGNLPAVIAAK